MTHLDDSPLPRLPPRDPAGHKGTFGTVAIAGGCSTGDARMIGAPALAGRGALRAGAGLVKLLMPAPILDAGILACPSATGIPLPVDPMTGEVVAHEASERLDHALEHGDVVVVGPGLGTGEGVRALALRAVQQTDVPVVVDADALNALAQVPELWRDFHARAILTPHPGEYRRLAEALKLPTAGEDDASRRAAAATLAQRLGCIVVLKGAGTVVSDGQRSWTCAHRHAVLATAGTGDVLAGVIASLAGQFARDGLADAAAVRGATKPHPTRLTLYDATRLAVEAHARAGERWARDHAVQAGLLAPELADAIPQALESLRAP